MFKISEKDLKVAVIRQELLELTGDYRQAIILNQFIYWTPRIRDHDLFLEEEHARSQNMEIEFRNGWIYKTAKELADETMLGLSPSNIRRHTIKLVENGWLQERNNPKYKWDKTLQYRLDTVKLKKDLFRLGYVVNIDRKYAVSKIENGETKIETHDKQNRNAIPETTIEITSKTTLKDIRVLPGATRNSPISYDEYNFTSADKKEIVAYYIKTYSNYMNKQHPKLKPSQWKRVDSGLESIYNKEIDVSFDSPEVDEWKQMIDKHFETEYENCDYNILHFVTDGVKIKRMYETIY